MANRKIKPKKGAEKTPEILTSSERFKAWIDENYSYLLGGLIVLLLIPTVMLGYNTYKSRAERLAGADYATVTAKWPGESTDPKEWENAAPELEKFIKEHEGTEAVLNARLDLAQVYLRLQRYDDSLKLEEGVLREIPATHNLRPLVRYQLAMTLQAAGKNDDALAQWNALKDEGFSGFDRVVYWNLGRLTADKKDYGKAAEFYELALKAQGSYPEAALIESELASVKLKTSTAGKPKEGSGAS